MKKSLYEISKEYEEIAYQLEEGELTPELETALSITESELQNKAINYGYVVKQFEDDISTVDNEIKRLQAIKKAKTNAKERIKDTLSNAMQHFGIEKVETPTLRLSFRSSKAVEIFNEDQLDKKYIIEKITYSPDKRAINKAIESGDKVEGAVIVNNKNLQIK